MSWDPEVYLKFRDERERPILDLLARLAHASPRRIVDLGCGPGNSTAHLVRLFPQADCLGIDNSPEMIRAAEAGEIRARFELADIAEFTPEPGTGLLFSNAALHWLPDHASLLPRLFGALEPGGVLAFQVPASFRDPAHEAVRAVAGAAPWAERLAGAGLGADAVASLEAYHRMLRPLAGALELWRTTYLHVLEGEDPVLGWMRGTALRPLLARLAPGEREPFERALAARLAAAHPREADGRTLFPFTRLFAIAVRA